MRYIVPPDAVVKAIMGFQKYKAGHYRWSRYVIKKEIDEGLLLYNTLTSEMLFCSIDECENYADGELIERWFRVPLEFDEFLLAKKTKKLRQLVYRAVASRMQNVSVERYWILTTTNCNARCFYCHENGIPHMNMSSKTAEDVVDYIVKNSPDNSVHLNWYGGEPLINQAAIDIISSRLKKRGVSFVSSMISNGYCFDDVTIQKATEIWHLEDIQITLDGLEETYNRVKDYIYQDTESPFRKVLKNIADLLDAHVKVKIRLNIDNYNKKELSILSDLLIERFSGRDGFSIYTAPLMETCLGTVNQRTKQQRQEVYQAHWDLSEKLNQAGVIFETILPKVMRSELRCIAVSNVRVIFPDGQLAFCHDYVDGVLSGSIYGNESTEEEKRQYTVCLPEKSQCRDCVKYPQCIRLKKCFNNQCNEELVKEWVWMTQNEMIWEYKKSE